MPPYTSIVTLLVVNSTAEARRNELSAGKTSRARCAASPETDASFSSPLPYVGPLGPWAHSGAS